MHEAALTKPAQQLFPKFSALENFYLVGGTALALQIGHRLSVDFDFFCYDPLPTNLLAKVKRLFKEHSIIVTYRSSEQLNLLIHDIKITFFQYEYPVLDPLISYQAVSIASIAEIAAMKAFSIGRRLSYKDYIDWYFLLKEEHVHLSDAIMHANKKFAGDFNDRLFLGQLVSLADIHTQKIQFLRDEVSQETVQAFLEDIVRQYPI